MKRVLRHGLQEIEIRSWYERPSQDSRILEFSTESTALYFLYPFLTDPWNLFTLRQVLVEDLSYPDVTQLDDHEVLEQVAWHMTHGQIRLVSLEASRWSTRVSRKAAPKSAVREDEQATADTMAEPIPPPARQRIRDEEQAEEEGGKEVTPAPVMTHWIKFQILDESTGQPLPGIGLKIKLPIGAIQEYTTDANGMIHITDLPDGTCDIERIVDAEALEVIELV